MAAPTFRESVSEIIHAPVPIGATICFHAAASQDRRGIVGFRLKNVKQMLFC
jgi:hypothetical protein